MPLVDLIKRREYQNKFQKQRIICDCGKEINRSSKPYHITTLFHKMTLENQKLKSILN